MNINLREAILHRLQNKTESELEKMISDSIGGEERVLPGLGVILEMVWSELDVPTKQLFSHHLTRKISSIATK